MDGTMDVFSTDEAAQYLGCTRDNIVYHRQKGNLFGRIVGNSLVFTKDELDSFRRAHMARGITKKEIAETYNVSASLVQYYMRRGELVPVGKNKQSWVFDPVTVQTFFEGRGSGDAPGN